MSIPAGLLRNRVVAITGASQGIGRGIALGCAQAGARVVVHHLGTEGATRDAETLLSEIGEIRGKMAAQGNSLADRSTAAAIEVGGDISDPATADKIVRAAVNEYGRIDGLVSNAGICPFYSFLDIPHDAWQKTRSVNLDGAFYVVQAVARQMSQQEPKGGSIVAVSSISALVGGGQQACARVASAFAVWLMGVPLLTRGVHGQALHADQSRRQVADGVVRDLIKPVRDSLYVFRTGGRNCDLT